MLILLIVVPCAIVGIGVVTLFDRIGAFSGLDGGSRPSRGGPSSSGLADHIPRAAWGGPSSSGLADSIPRVALIGLMAVMGAWVVAWIVLLVIGLGIFAG